MKRRLLITLALAALFAACTGNGSQQDAAASNGSGYPFQHVQHVKQASFQAEVLQATQPVLVDFSAAWCAPCKRMAPVLDSLAQARTHLAVVNVDVDESPDLARRYDVAALPTLIFFREGQPVHKALGYKDASQTFALADSLLQPAATDSSAAP